MKILNISIPDFKTLKILEHQDVEISGGRVSAVTPHPKEETFIPVPAGETIIDGAGKYLIPGLVNTHAHTSMTLLRGTAEDLNAADWFNKRIWIYEQGLTPKDIYIGALLGAAEMLLSGVTCAADHYFAMDRVWEAFLQTGIRGDLSWAVFGLGEKAEENYRTALEFTREYKDKDPRLTVSLGPHSPYLCPDEFLKRTAEDAGRLGLKIHIHAAEDERQMVISRRDRGKTPVEVLYDTGILQDKGKSPGTILAHAYWSTDSDLELAARCGAAAAHCPKTYARFGDFHDFLPRALERGLRVGLGSDGPASNSNMSLLEAARLAALIAKATRGNAEYGSLGQILPLLFGGGEVLGMEGYGTIAPGVPADLVLLDPNTPEMLPGNNFFADLLYCADPRNVHTVIVDGRVVVEKGKLLTLDFQALAREARDRARRLTSTRAEAPMQTY